jgi:putative methionine-R-sulfoxide reductase with GAF domain
MSPVMLQSEPDKRGLRASGDTTIPAIERVLRPGDPVLDGHLPAARNWAAIGNWAATLVEEIARDQPAQHVSVFVADPAADGLRLVGQIWGAGEDTGEVVVGEWLVPFQGSVCGRVARTGAAALCADVTLDPDYRGFPGGRSRSSLTVPVGPAGAVVAVINIEAPWVGAFSIRDHDDVAAAAAAAFGSFPG